MHTFLFTVERIHSAWNKPCVDIHSSSRYVLSLAAEMYNGECVIGVLNAASALVMTSYENHIHLLLMEVISNNNICR